MGIILKSAAAVLIYLMILPFLAIVSHHRFMKFLTKICYHLGRILTAAGIEVIREKYVVE